MAIILIEPLGDFVGPADGSYVIPQGQATATPPNVNPVRMAVGMKPPTNVPGTFVVEYMAVDAASNMQRIHYNMTLEDPTKFIYATPTNTEMKQKTNTGFSIPDATVLNGTGKVTITKIVSPAWDPDKVGDYTVTYSAEDSSSTPVVITRTMKITLEQGPPKPPSTGSGFETGSTLRDGTDSTGTAYETSVKAEAVDADVTTEAYQSAYFDEQAMDPYEVANAK